MGSLRTLAHRERKGLPPLSTHFEVCLLKHAMGETWFCLDWKSVPINERKLANSSLRGARVSGTISYYQNISDIPKEYDKELYTRWYPDQQIWSSVHPILGKFMEIKGVKKHGKS